MLKCKIRRFFRPDYTVGTLCVFADYTAGEDLHLALKQIYDMPNMPPCQVQKQFFENT